MIDLRDTTYRRRDLIALPVGTRFVNEDGAVCEITRVEEQPDGMVVFVDAKVGTPWSF